MINKLFIDGREPPPPPTHPPAPPPRSLTVYRTDLSTNRIVRRSLDDQDYLLLSLAGVLMTHTCVDKNIICMLTHLTQVS